MTTMRLDDLVIALLLIVVGAVRVVPQLAVGGSWGAESTLAAVMLGLGVLLLIGTIVDRTR